MAIHITHGKYQDKDLDRELREVINAIKELQSGLSSTVVSLGGSGISSGGVSIPSTLQIRKGIVVLTAGNQTVTFDTDMSSSTFALPQLRCYTTVDGYYEDVGAVISNKTIHGFDINPIKACTCEYIALYY